MVCTDSSSEDYVPSDKSNATAAGGFVALLGDGEEDLSDAAHPGSTVCVSLVPDEVEVAEEICAPEVVLSALQTSKQHLWENINKHPRRNHFHHFYQTQLSRCTGKPIGCRADLQIWAKVQ